MTMINKMVDYLISRNIISSNSREIYSYGLFVFFYNLFLVLNILVDGIVLNEFQFTILFLLFWIPYRIFIGGIHCSTPIRCMCFFNICYLCALALFKLVNLNILIAINIVLFFIQLYKECRNGVYILFWIVYGILIIIFESQLVTILSIAYLCNSFLKCYELYSNKKYLY